MKYNKNKTGVKLNRKTYIQCICSVTPLEIKRLVQSHGLIELPKYHIRFTHSIG